MGEINSKCQVPTPHEIVVQMLDQVGYINDLYGKRVLENSCGSGGFLTEIVNRYIEDCISQHYTEAQIKEGLQRDIHGFEKDRRLHKLCVSNLTKVAEKYGLSNVHWNIKRKNALHAIKRRKYQFVVGNPPYLAYPELDSETRKFLRTQFKSCKKGKPDYYYAFIEVSLRALADDGKLIYLVPGNFMKNMYSEDLRQLLLPSLCEIIDYSHHKIFKNVLTSSVIIFCNQASKADFVRYEDRHYARVYHMPKTTMRGKWLFDEQNYTDLVRFSDFFHASAPVATQLNRAFVISKWEEFDERFIRVGTINIERSVLRHAAGPKALQKGQHEKIIFPYSYDHEGILTRYSEDAFREQFPGAYEYLFQFRTDLINRKSDRQAQWFEYGRSQLLSRLKQEKLILSSFITGNPRIYLLNEDTIPYAGICVTARNGHAVEQARTVLESPEFMEYVRRIGVCTNGVSYRISPTDINSFYFSRELLEE